MPDNEFPESQWKLLQEKLDAFNIAYKEKRKAYENAVKENLDPEIRKWLDNDSKDAWDSIEKTKMDMDEFKKKYRRN